MMQKYSPTLLRAIPAVLATLFVTVMSMASAQTTGAFTATSLDGSKDTAIAFIAVAVILVLAFTVFKVGKRGAGKV